MIVDLFPRARPNHYEPLERACEYIETGRHFSKPSLARAAGGGPDGWSAARQAIESLLAVDLIRRVSPAYARPVLYIRSDGAA